MNGSSSSRPRRFLFSNLAHYLTHLIHFSISRSFRDGTVDFTTFTHCGSMQTIRLIRSGVRKKEKKEEGEEVKKELMGGMLAKGVERWKCANSS